MCASIHARWAMLLILSVCTLAQAQKGIDLVVVDFWEENQQIQVQIQNQGSSTCASGHILALTVNNQNVDNVMVSTTLDAGKSLTTVFPKYTWQCSQDGPVYLLVQVDVDNVIQETDENNNYRQETWICDVTAPVIISGPEAQQIGTESARIVWTTDEDSDSTVRWGTQSDHYAKLIYRGTLTSQHSLDLTQLTPATQYFYRVRSSDEAGNRIESQEFTFTTSPLARPDLIIPMLSIDDHVVSGTLKNQGVGLAPAGHTVSLSVGGVQYDEVVIEVNLAPGQETLFTFPHFYFQCEEFSQGLIAEADVLSEVTESNETNNTRPLIILCEAPLAIIDGPRAEVGNGQASITWETNVDANSLCDYGLAAGLYGDRAERTTPTRYHKLILDDLLPGTTYQYRVTSINPYGIRTQSRPAYFTTGMTGDSTPPIIKSLTIVREPGVPLVYRMEAEAWDADSGVRQVQFFMDDELIGTDYSEPFEFLLTPGMLALSREEFFRSHRFSAVAVDGAMLATDHSTLFTPAYECAEIVAEFVEPYHNETLYTRNTTVDAGTTLPIRVYAAEMDWHCFFSPIGNHRGEHPLICDESTLDVNEVRFYANTVHLGTVTTSSDDPWRQHQFTLDWDLGGYATGTYHLRVDAVSDEDCIQTLTRDIQIVQGETEITLERRVWREGHVFTIELILRNEGTLPYPLNWIQDRIVGFQPIARINTDDDYEIMINPQQDHCLSWDVSIEAGLTHGVIELSPGHSFVGSYQAIPIQFIHSGIGHGVGAHEVEVVSGHPDVRTDTFDMITRVTEDGELIDDAFEVAVAEANYLVVTHPEALIAQYGQNATEDVLSTAAELARDRQGVLAYVKDTNPSDDEDWLKDTAIRTWGANMTGSDGVAGHFLSNGYLVLVGETEILPAFNVNIPDWPYGDGKVAKRVYFTDGPYADMSGSDSTPELITGRIIGDSGDQLVQAMRNSLDATFDRSLGVVTSGSEGDWENFVGHASEIASLWREQQLDGVIMNEGFQMHHWSRYIHKEGMEAPYYFPMDAGDGFLAANLTGGRVELIRLDPGTHQARLALHEALNYWTSPFYHEPYCTFNTGDAIASGDIDGDGEDEIVIGSIGTDEIIIGYDDSEPATRDTAFSVPLNPWDVIACGDLRGDAREEIVVASCAAYGTVWIFSYENVETPSLTLLDTLDYIPFDSWDGFAIGNVDTNSPGNEIVVGNASDDIIAVYTGMGTFRGQFPCDPYTAYDALAVGNFDGGPGDEIAVIIDDTVDSKRRLKVFQADCWVNDPNDGWSLRDDHSSTLYSRFLDFHGIRTTGSSTRSDGFVAADIDADGKEELLLAKESDDRLYILDAHYSQGWKDRYLPEVTQNEDNIDLMAIRGHGNVNSCSPFKTADIASFNFNDSPLVFGLSCLTGGYEGQWIYEEDGSLVTRRLGDYAFANAFFDQGAAVYIGSTEISSSSNNHVAGPAFFRSWDVDKTAGKAFRNFERSHSSGDGWKTWIKEYNYYGDPKFGALDSRGDMIGGRSLRSPHAIQIDKDPNQLHVTLDDYQIQEVNGVDEVTIPGGTLLIQHGRPLIPCLRIEHQLDPGILIQEVQLCQREDLVEAQGLNLPLANTQPELEGLSQIPVTSTFSGWFPTEPLTWEVLSNGEGSRTLQVELYPFIYNNVTQETRYYRSFDLELVSLNSPIYIVTVGIDPNIVVGDQVNIDLALYNNGVPRDVVIQATLKRYGTDESLGGLLIDRLDTLMGPATYRSQWDSTGQVPGHCVLDVSLVTPSGDLLDQRTRNFRITEK